MLAIVAITAGTGSPSVCTRRSVTDVSPHGHEQAVDDERAS
jgi:hypothetical protein